MNPTIAVAPAPRNLMQDIAPPQAVQSAPVQAQPRPVQLVTIAAPAPAQPMANAFNPAPAAPMAAPVPQASAPATNPVATQPSQPAHPANPQIQQAKRSMHPKSTTPVLVIIIAMAVTAALVFAALYAYHQGSLSPSLSY